MGRHRLYALNEHVFDQVVSEPAAYFLGLWAADGYLNSSERYRTAVGIDLNKRDVILLEGFRSFLEFTGPLRETSHDMLRLQWYSGHMAQQFRDYGFDSNKSLTLSRPRVTIPDAVFHHFIRGYIDGNGSWNFSNNGAGKYYLNLSVRSTPSFCEFINAHLPVKLNYIFSVTGMLYSKRKAVVASVGEWLYNGATIFLPRKRDIYEQYRVERSSKDDQEKPSVIKVEVPQG